MTFNPSLRLQARPGENQTIHTGKILFGAVPFVQCNKILKKSPDKLTANKPSCRQKLGPEAKFGRDIMKTSIINPRL
jgi:hypothetical protein